MGCFLGCFGGAKESKRPRRRVNRGSPQRQFAQRNRVQNVQKEIVVDNAERSIEETPKTDLVSELGNKPEEKQELSPSLSQSPRKRVTFNSNITTYEHISIHESVDSLPDRTSNVDHEISKSPCQSHSVSEDSDPSVTSSVVSYPPNHRYHNARYSDDEAEEYGDSDLDDVDDDDDDDDDDEDEYDDDEDEFDNDEDGWCESALTESMESKTGGDSLLQTIDEDTASKNNHRSHYMNSVLNPVENLTQWKAVKTRGKHALKPQKENLISNIEAARVSYGSDPTFKSKSGQTKSSDQEISVDASLSTWLVSPETTPVKKSGGFETVTSEQMASGGCNNNNSAKSFEDRPILGALTVEELRQISASNSPRKSPRKSPDDMPILGTVGTYWNHSSSEKKNNADSAASFKGIPNTTSKYREDKTVNWHSTPFETRLNRALNNQRV